MAKKKITIDDLARMVANGFLDMGKQISELKDQNEKDHEDIKLRLDNAAWRFELKALEERVGVLEERAGVGK